MAKDKKRRMLRPFLGAASLLLALGFGNITFGRYKADEYARLLQKASETTTSTPRPTEAGPFGLGGETDTRGRYIAKLRARVDFYEFVVFGGWAIVGLSVLSATFALIATRPNEDDEPVK